MVWIIIIVHVHWTKLESTSIQFKREDKVIWALVRSTIMHMRATQHFNHGLLLSTPKGKKRNKIIYTRKLPTSKRRTRNLVGFSFNITTMHRKEINYN